jgi:hypothetical protein
MPATDALVSRQARRIAQAMQTAATGSPTEAAFRRLVEERVAVSALCIQVPGSERNTSPKGRGNDQGQHHRRHHRL